MGTDKTRLLIVDDEQVVCDLLSEELSEHGYQCDTALDAETALHKLETGDYNVALLDIRLPGMSGLDLLHEIRQKHQGAAAIMITAISTIETAVEAMALGAVDYIVKPFDLDKVETSICAAVLRQQMAAANRNFSRLDAIARGVERKMDPLAAFSKMVSEEAVKIARLLDIPEEDINQWLEARSQPLLSQMTVTE